MRSLVERLRAHAAGYLVLALLLVVSVGHWARETSLRIDEILYGGDYVRAPFELGLQTGDLIALQPEALTAGLREGEELLQVEGQPLQGFSDYYGVIHDKRRGDTLRVRVRAPGGEPRDVTIPLGTYEFLGFAKGESVAYPLAVSSTIVLPLISLALGFWVASVRIADPVAWYLLFFMLTIANAISRSESFFGSDEPFQPFFSMTSVFFSSLGPAALALFGLAFSGPFAFDRRFPWIKWVALAPAIASSVVTAAIVGTLLGDTAKAATLWNTFAPLVSVARAVSFASLAAFGIALAVKTWNAPTRDARRRMLLLDVGAAVPLGLLLLVGYSPIVSARWQPVVEVAMLLLLPISMAYVIVVQRAMDVRVAVRQGLQYLLASGGVRVFQVIVSLAIVIAAATLDAGDSLPARVAFIAGGFLLLAGVRGFALRLRAWIDRRFFREAYEADAILSELARTVPTIVETKKLLATVATRIAATLHVSRIVIFLGEHTTVRPVYLLGFDDPATAALSLSIPGNSALVTYLRQEPHLHVRAIGPESPVQPDSNDMRILSAIGSELLLALALNGRLLGIMSLGEKQSEEPYSASDVHLLESVAAQTGLALENARLASAIAYEVGEREKQKREIEIARSVQERLFPQEYPPVPGLDYAGACRPALGVGGDYYDFIPLSASALGIAIGDVSGKGIPAALLMASLRAFLRGQTIERRDGLPRVMSNLNHLVFESSATNRYATFFYAEFDAGSRSLSYVNAGHNPPMLLRANGGVTDLVRLETGGPVIGMLEDCTYTLGSVTLAPGDLVVAYTDGVSEAMDASDDEWGEERMIETIRAHRADSPPALIEALMRAADAFAAGAPQHDDMTLIVLRVM